MFCRFEKESFWIVKRVLLVSKRGPFEGQKDNYWKAKGVLLEKVSVKCEMKKSPLKELVLQRASHC